MSAPERIWAEAWWQGNAHFRRHDAGDTDCEFPNTEYVRADMVEAAVNRALEWAAKSVTFRSDQIAIRAASPDTIAKLAKGE